MTDHDYVCARCGKPVPVRTGDGGRLYPDDEHRAGRARAVAFDLVEAEVCPGIWVPVQPR